MYIALWILLCLLASIGAVQALSWLICILGRPPGQVGAGRAYQVIPLERDPGMLEQQLRYEIHLLRWSSTNRPGQLVLLDTGLGEEARKICWNMLAGMGMVIICRPEDIARLIRGEEGALAESL